MKRFVVALLLVQVLFSCKTQKEAAHIAQHAMVVSAREEASKIGVAVMQQGGNAFDAMVATSMALAVSYPFAGNIGGGGFMVYRTAQGEEGSLDYREKAPLAAHEKMYQDKQGNVIPRLSLDGALAVGVPGTVAGMWEAHQKLGKLTWAQVMQPAIDLANKGIVITEKQAHKLNQAQEKFKKINQGREVLFVGDFKKGDLLIQKNLAKTLEKIRDGGRAAFYQGAMAEQISKFVQENGGIISLEDMRKYEPQWRDPISFNFRDYKITTMGPPSSGGIVLVQILKTIEKYPLKKYKHNTAKYIQLITEAERRAYADRAHFLGDPDFVKIPIKELMSEEYLKDRMKDFNPEKATPSQDISHGKIEWTESNETTHYSIVDTEGNAVSVTTTLNGAYGSKLYDNDLGMFFNNEMDDFSSKPGEPNLFGLIGGEANKIEPEKRMLSSMTPTIVAKNNKVYMVLGSPGGSTIITTVLQTFLNQSIFNMPMQKAVSSPRFHHQWLPDEVMVEPRGFDTETITELKKKGYKIAEKDNVILGKMDAILVLPNGELEAGADPRGDDAAAGF